eukprot:scaffold4092_cov84-Amphora_coffeaeformis.AAC.1
MGGDNGDPKYAITPGCHVANDVTCFPFTNPIGIGGKIYQNDGTADDERSQLWVELWKGTASRGHR